MLKPNNLWEKGKIKSTESKHPEKLNVAEETKSVTRFRGKWEVKIYFSGFNKSV